MNDSESIDSSAGATLGDIADQIDEQHKGALTAARTALSHAIEAGHLLTKAKNLVPHGEWLAWLGTRTAVGERQMQKYMRLYRRRAVLNANPGSHLTISQAVKIISTGRTKSPWDDNVEPLRPRPKVTFDGQEVKSITAPEGQWSEPGATPLNSLGRHGDGTPAETVHLSEYVNQTRAETAIVSITRPNLAGTLMMLVDCWNRTPKDDRQAFLNALSGTDDIALTEIFTRRVGQKIRNVERAPAKTARKQNPVER